jgi:hypothetical protein
MRGVRRGRGSILPAGKGDAVAFDGNAAAQWMPAFERARAYAKTLGFRDLRFEGTGVMAKGIRQGPFVNATELQRLTLIDRAGGEHPLPNAILPEAAHLRSLKSSETLFEIMKHEIDQRPRRGG